VILAAEHYLDTQAWNEAFGVCDANQHAPGALQRVKLVLEASRLSKAELESIEKDEARSEPNPRVRFVIRDKGAFVLELFEDDAPHAVTNFMDLVVNRKYYDGMRFHDVVGGSHAGIGDPRTRPGATAGDKEDGPAWRLRPDDSPRPMLRGYVATVPLESGGAMHGSRFILSVVPMPGHERQSTVFGRVVGGLEILDNLEQDDRLEKIEVLRKRNHTYDPQPARLR
jgi:cyclophilin family peptidyl-prolyl cis-trans isomerase